MFITEEQKAVCEYRYAAGYEMLGKTISLTNGLAAFVMCKGRHTMCINSLGYDEHYLGRIYKVEDVTMETNAITWETR